jgi:ADP-ribosylglycohydrolase
MEQGLDFFVRREIVQRREEGCDIEAIEEQVEKALQRDDGLKGVELYTILHNLESLQPEESFPYVEPCALEDIRAQRPDGPRCMEYNLTDAQMFDRIHGAWLGRAAGCILGKPVEGWKKDQIDSYLRLADALPLNDYIPLVDEYVDKHEYSDLLKRRMADCTRGRIQYMARDDDMDYPVLGLHILESHGPDFTSRNVASTWLSRLSYNLVYTAERVAYRNLVNQVWPPESGTYRNPYREWIGAQIRADILGYACPGWPEKAAEFAYRDAVVSHAKNGIYGEMFVAAMLAAAFATDDVEEVIRIGLSEIPEQCRLAEAIQDTVAWSKELAEWEKVWDKINAKYGHYHTVHTINNAALVVMALMTGKLDYEAIIVAAVRGGWDTDCNGATAGSICGLMLGAEALPQKWVGVLNDRLFSAVRGYGECTISDLARRTHEVAKKVTAEAG